MAIAASSLGSRNLKSHPRSDDTKRWQRAPDSSGESNGSGNLTTDSMNLTLNSKVALITGGSRGIGAAAVRLFVGAGAKVVFNYQSAKAQAEDLVRECGAANCRGPQSDLSTMDAAGQ